VIVAFLIVRLFVAVGLAVDAGAGYYYNPSPERAEAPCALRRPAPEIGADADAVPAQRKPAAFAGSGSWRVTLRSTRPTGSCIIPVAHTPAAPQSRRHPPLLC